MTTMLTETKFLRFHDFTMRHIGRDALTVRIGCRFHGFREPHYESAMLPTKEAFLLNGQHYFMPDETTIIIGPSWLATGYMLGRDLRSSAPARHRRASQTAR
jgi:hypothetical protein